MVFTHPSFSPSKVFKAENINGVATACDSLTLSNDRLSYGENLWNKNNILSTRPGLAVTTGGVISNPSSVSDINKVFYADFPLDVFYGYNRLCAVVKECGLMRTDVDFFVTDSSGRAHYLTLLELVGANGETSFQVKNVLFIKDKPIRGCGIFILIPVCRYERATDSENKYVLYYELNSDYNGLISTNPTAFYRPLIVKNGLGDSPSSETLQAYTPAYPEGVNILGGNFQACFIADDRSSVFMVPSAVAENAPVEIRVYINKKDYLCFTVPVGKSSSNTVEYMTHSIYAYFTRSTGELIFLCDDGAYKFAHMLANNQIQVFSYADTEAAAYELLSRNARPVSFDDRIFFPGGENRGNKIYYSGKGLPLYYSERNYIPVGDTNYDLTALSLQSKYIIAFKEKELYRLSLTESAYVSRQSLMDDTAVFEAPVPTCKTTRINDSIGCDLPTTIINCCNRLVWFHSDGAVYTLYGSNLYTEGSVYELSGEISDRLKNLSYELLNSVFAAELAGYYALGVGDTLYIMDTRVSGFRYLSGYGSKSKSHTGLPWFIWKAPKSTAFVSAFLCGGNEYFIMRSTGGDIFYIATPKGEADVVPCSDGGNTESLPEYCLSTAIFGDDLLYSQRITVNAAPKNGAEFQVFHKDGIIKTASVKAKEGLRRFVIPLHYKRGGIGLTVRGKGKFYLKSIIYECCDKKY